MSREVFERLHTPTWERFELLLDRLDRDDSEGAESFPTLYRQICFHLALVRSRLYGSDLEERLNLLARRGHEQLYAARPVLAKELLRLLAVEFPRLVRKEGKLVLAAMLLFYGPYFGMMIAVILSPALI